MLWGMKCPLCQNEIARPPTFKAAVDMHIPRLKKTKYWVLQPVFSEGKQWFSAKEVAWVQRAINREIYAS